MRTLDERMAEIRRRSERILNRRKKRRAVLAGCIPLLILCVSLAVYRLQPPAQPGNTNTGAMGAVTPTEAIAEGMDEMAQMDGTDRAVLAVQIQSDTKLLTCTDSQKADAIVRQLRRLTVLPPETSSSTQHSGSSADSEQAETGSGEPEEARGIAITVTYSDGTDQRYLLTGDRLQDLATNRRYTLTPDQLQSLLSALGLEGGDAP